MAARRGRPPKKKTETKSKAKTAKKTTTKRSTSSKKNSVVKKDSVAKAKITNALNRDWYKQYSLPRSEWLRRGLLFVVLSYAVINYRGLFMAASVNGRPVSRLSVISQLEKQDGKNVLENLINESLIRQKAKNSYVTVTDADIEQAILDIEQNILGPDQSIDDILALQGMTRDDLAQQLELQVMVEKLLEGDVTVSDEELNEFVEANRDSISEDFTEEDLRNSAREQIRQQKLQARYSSWMQELRDEANINYYVEY